MSNASACACWPDEYCRLSADVGRAAPSECGWLNCPTLKPPRANSTESRLQKTGLATNSSAERNETTKKAGGERSIVPVPIEPNHKQKWPRSAALQHTIARQS